LEPPPEAPAEGTNRWTRSTTSRGEKVRGSHSEPESFSASLTRGGLASESPGSADNLPFSCAV
jgi:hypothetical protein